MEWQITRKVGIMRPIWIFQGTDMEEDRQGGSCNALQIATMKVNGTRTLTRIVSNGPARRSHATLARKAFVQRFEMASSPSARRFGEKDSRMGSCIRLCAIHAQQLRANDRRGWCGLGANSRVGKAAPEALIHARHESCPTLPPHPQRPSLAGPLQLPAQTISPQARTA